MIGKGAPTDGKTNDGEPSHLYSKEEAATGISDADRPSHKKANQKWKMPHYIRMLARMVVWGGVTIRTTIEMFSDVMSHRKVIVPISNGEIIETDQVSSMALNYIDNQFVIPYVGNGSLENTDAYIALFDIGNILTPPATWPDLGCGNWGDSIFIESYGQSPSTFAAKQRRGIRRNIIDSP